MMKSPLFAVFVILILGCLCILFLRFRSLFLKGKPSKEVPPEKNKKAILLAAVPVLILAVLCTIRPHFFVVPVLHLMGFWILFDLILFIVNKIKKTPYWLSAAIAIPVTVVYMGVGFFLAVHVYKTEYKVETDKAVAPLRIALIADSHVGAFFDGEGFAERIEKIGEQDPDVLLISGDFVDDDTKKKDMVTCCEALGKLQLKYGVYYVMGNHDVGSGDQRDFSFDELIAELEKNHVHVLLDEVAEIGGEYYIVGRKDKSVEREPIEDLTADLDKSRYIIVLDHQPADYAAEKEAGCDLVLCGHTHGGQMIPVGPLFQMIGSYDDLYGRTDKGDTTFIVTSGIGGIAVPYKTGTISEYCLIDITPDENAVAERARKIAEQTTEPTEAETTTESTTESTTEATSETTPEATLDPNIDRTCYPYEEPELPELTEQQKQIYDDLCEKIGNFEPYFYDRKELGYDYMDDLLYVMGLVEQRHLEFTNYFEIREVLDDQSELTGMQLEYWCRWENGDPSYDINDVKAGMEAFDKKVDEILSGLTDDMTAYEKYYYLASQISYNQEYDYTGYASVQAAPWAGIMGGQSICAGYSASMEYLCKKAGLYCKTVSGIVRNEGHAWNLIKLPEGTYYVDVTWADGTGEVGSYGWRRYFALTQEQILIDHEIADDTVATGQIEFVTIEDS